MAWTATPGPGFQAMGKAHRLQSETWVFTLRVTAYLLPGSPAKSLRW